MEDLYCRHCGKKLEPNERFCAQCGAPRPYGSGVAPGQVPVQPPYRPQPPMSPSPYAVPQKAPTYRIVLLTVLVMLLVGAAGFGVWRLFIEPASGGSSQADANPLSSDSRNILFATPSPGTSGKPPASSKAASQTPSVIPTPVKTSTPIPTPTAYYGGFTQLIGKSGQPGITEAKANALFGKPNSRDQEEYGDGEYVYLDYGTFELGFPYINGKTTFCDYVMVKDDSAPVKIFVLTIGMTQRDVELTVGGTSFEIDYKEPDDSYWVYADSATKQKLFITFEKGNVTMYSAYYDPE